MMTVNFFFKQRLAICTLQGIDILDRISMGVGVPDCACVPGFRPAARPNARFARLGRWWAYPVHPKYRPEMKKR